ncbi:hypothetical protein HELRODRAFT_159775 [Helobdella robusta]|uniref:Uncharacterized protein n=1 Tax=Helobdella robusta TaxID=6412 RepID=T1EPE2_HELRO|nr:hypothetical protein HELRODRAFT_159775 [Helobdella robusta]ESO13150.1 hypothetical protein HELRODRAFT_159775 [Helobdella robusta]
MSTYNNYSVPYGETSKHVLLSRGADDDVMKFYATTNQLNYHKKFLAGSYCKLYDVKNIQSGYTSNRRVFVRYTPELDLLDNPKFGEPHLQHIMPDRKQTYLDKVLKKDPLQQLNKGYGPDLSQSETKERFQGSQLEVAPHNVLNSKKFGSGFTNNQNMDPITFKPDEAYDNILPGKMTQRPTGVSTMKSEYLPCDVIDGTEPNIRMSCGTNHRSGYTNSSRPIEARSPFSCFDPSPEKPSVTFGIKITDTGYTANRGPTWNWRDEIGGINNNYVTEYKYRFLERDVDRENRKAEFYGNIRDCPSEIRSGYSGSNMVHTGSGYLGQGVGHGRGGNDVVESRGRDGQEEQCLLDYQTRSIIARDNNKSRQFYRKSAPCKE